MGELRAFFGPLADEEAMESVVEAEKRLRSAQLVAQVELTVRERRDDELATLVKRLPEIVDRQDQERVVHHINNVLFRLVTERRTEQAKALLEAYLSAVAVVGHTDAMGRGLKTEATFSIRESIASFAAALASIANDDELFAMTEQLLPERITYDVLAFNLACFQAIRRNKIEMLRWIQVALSLGKRADEFLSDTDFEAYRGDRDFTAALAKK